MNKQEEGNEQGAKDTQGRPNEAFDCLENRLQCNALADLKVKTLRDSVPWTELYPDLPSVEVARQEKDPVFWVKTHTVFTRYGDPVLSKNAESFFVTGYSASPLESPILSLGQLTRGSSVRFYGLLVEHWHHEMRWREIDDNELDYKGPAQLGLDIVGTWQPKRASEVLKDFAGYEVFEAWHTDMLKDWAQDGRVGDCSSSRGIEPQPKGLKKALWERFFGPSRRQAIEAGFLVDVTPRASGQGFTLPVAVTRAVWDRHIAVPEEEKATLHCNVEAYNVDDIIGFCQFGRGRIRGPRVGLIDVPTEQYADHGPVIVTLKSVLGPDEEGNACLTLMLPEEG
jgi:hypothetical protein